MADQKPIISRRIRLVIGVTLLLAVMAAELALSARQQSQTFDEAAHIFAGYRYWKTFDFGANPEHPPLVKLVAAIPLLRLPLRVPSIPDADLKWWNTERGANSSTATMRMFCCGEPGWPRRSLRSAWPSLFFWWRIPCGARARISGADFARI